MATNDQQIGKVAQIIGSVVDVEFPSGLLPMMYATGSGSDIQRPLAAVVMGGLVTSLVLTLVLLPVLYFMFESRRDRCAQAESAGNG